MYLKENLPLLLKTMKYLKSALRRIPKVTSHITHVHSVLKVDV